jgi:homocysteine S-methyltransferase
MIGVNCSKPVYIAGLIREIRAGLQEAAKDGGRMIPIGVYPNSGEEYDAVTKTWHGVGDSKSFGEYALDYMRAGADAAGGSCTTVASHVEQVIAAKEAFLAGGSARAMTAR